MAGTIIADYIRTDANKLSLNVGNTTFATINATGFYSNTGVQIINQNGQVNASSIVAGSIPGSALSTSANTIPRSSMTTGAVLQVIQAQTSTATSFTTTSFATISGLTASITPTSSSSKILVLVNLQGQNRTAGLGEDFQILRDGSSVFVQNHYSLINGAGLAGNPDGNGQGGMAPVMYLDSPSSTSSVTYTFQMRHRTGNSGTFSVNYATGATGTVYSTVILMEIAG